MSMAATGLTLGLLSCPWLTGSVELVSSCEISSAESARKSEASWPAFYGVADRLFGFAGGCCAGAGARYSLGALSSIWAATWDRT